ncbi:MAG: hypothetical protein JXB49_18240 [Bacteroidales bacterium]|nr:hypothetical protein [Bacteroidales bacterium]
MMIKKRTIITAGLFILILTSCIGRQPYKYIFNLEDLAKGNKDLQKIDTIDKFLYTPSSDSSVIEFAANSQEIEWNKANYLICNVYHDNDYSALLYFQFFRKKAKGEKAIIQQGKIDTDNPIEQPRIVAKIGVLPQLQTQVIFPLKHLNGQTIFLHKYPRQLKGTVLGSRMDKASIEKIHLVLGPYSSPDFRPSIRISSIYLSEEMPGDLPKESNPVMDEYGQWTAKSWKNKITKLSEMKSKQDNLQESIKKADYPSDWSRFGGNKKLFFGGSGFFRTHYDGKRWWLVDPDGYAFLSSGVDCIGYNATTLINGNEDLFAWLPSQSDSTYVECFSQNNKGEGTLFNYYLSNFINIYGNKWKEKWTDLTRNMLKTYRFNTVANWSNLDFAKKSEIPYVLPLRGFPTAEPSLFRDFPDIFSAEYVKNANKYALQLEEFKDDPYLIGYFLANEPKWAFGEFNLAFEMFATNQQSETKKQCISFLIEKYGNNLKRFNKAWCMNLANFDELTGVTLGNETDLSVEASNDLNEFSKIMVRKYVKVVCDAVKVIDKNHLNLGLRYAWISSDLCYVAGEFFDVFSINGYNFPAPPETNEIYERSHKPIMIGEFHFGSIDRGLPATGIVGAKNQQARADAYRYYVEHGFARPEIVGIHYFQWIDQPVLGRSDGENYNIGFVDICGNPYQELTNAATFTNEAMYKVALKELEPFNIKIERIPQIYY